jgi:SAM-dependent methyltransferase
MTREQLAIAQEHAIYHADVFGYANVSFLEGTIEQLQELPLEPGQFDVIVSNCVLNLATDKGAVLRGVKRLLKPGGEFYFADVYADRRLPAGLRNDPVLYGECLGGALYWKDFLRLARQAGFADPRLVDDRPITFSDPRIQDLLGETRFFSATYRLFNLEGLEDACEDHGQAVIYQGTIPHSPHRFDLDGHHAIETGRYFPVCGNTYRMLTESRFADHFVGVGDFSRHYGLFPGCGESLPFASASGAQTAGPAACC